MKTIMCLAVMMFVLTNITKPQGRPRLSNIPVTHIQSPSNASYINNSQFYNKDNVVDNTRINTTSNGTYWQPGYSNGINSGNSSYGMSPNTSINGNGHFCPNVNMSNSTTIVLPNSLHINK